MRRMILQRRLVPLAIVFTMVFALSLVTPSLVSSLPVLADEFNPHFQADKTVVGVGEDITFENLTVGGTEPYSEVEWDFNNDGTPDVTYHDDVMRDVVHCYTDQGVYSVKLTMTDHTMTRRSEIRLDYIEVHGVTITTDPDPAQCLTPLDVDFTVHVWAGTAPYTYKFTWNWQYWQNDGDTALPGDDEAYARLFDGVLQETTVGPTAEDLIMVSHTFDIPGFYSVKIEVTDANGTSQAYQAIKTLGIVPEGMAFDAVGVCQEICVKGMDDAASIEWSLVSGVELAPEDIYDCEEPWVGTFDPVNHADDSSIIIRSMRRGDIHIYATISDDACGSGGDVVLHTQKKWGELDHSILDLNVEEAGIQSHTELVMVSPTSTGWLEETIEDTVNAIFLGMGSTETVGHAIVHWWLFENTEENEQLINDLMDHLDSHDGELDDDHWAAHGRYVTETLGGWIGEVNAEPFEVIDHWASDGGHASSTFRWEGYMDGKEWYYCSKTEDSWPAEDRGKAQAALLVNADELELCQSETAMIVVLVSYPGGADPKDDPFNGENYVIIEKAKKEFFKPLKMESTEPGTYTVDAIAEADTEVIKQGGGTPTVSVAQYDDNPGDGFSGDIGKYIDVHIDDPDGVAWIEIRLYYTDDEITGLDESTLTLLWWNGSAWVQCSPTGVNPDPIDGYSGYIWAKIRANGTVPTLADLVGTPFGARGLVPLEVEVDIKPTSCPNPLNVKSKGVLPVAILGTSDFDVTQIDPASVRLEGVVAPLRWAIEDVAASYEGDDELCEACATSGPDGYYDLTLKFDKQEVAATLVEVSDGKCLDLELIGNLKAEFGGRAITGVDYVVILKKGK